MVDIEERFNLEENVSAVTCKDESNGREDDVRVEISHDDSEVEKRFNGVSKSGSKWQARIRHPKLKVDVYLGCYDTPEAAALVVENKKAEFEEVFKNETYVNVQAFKDYSNGRQDDVRVETCHGGSDVGKRFTGVSKSGNKWRARVRHPKLKVDVDLGCYKSPEAAALVVKMKKAEFEEMFKIENCVNVETCKDDFNERQEDVRVETCDGDSEIGKRFNGVIKCGSKWLARVQDPNLKDDVYLGYYNSPEAAALVVKKKKAEFEEMFKSENRLDEETCKDETCHRNSKLEKRFPGVSMNGSKWRARVRHPKLKVDVDLGSYISPEAAALAVKKKKAEFEEMFKNENCTNVETFPGVYKTGNKWMAKVRGAYLGYYNSPKEAALAVKKKKAEFTTETCNSCKVDLKGRESVYIKECGRWGARIWHPKLKYNASLGSYKTREEAEVAVTNKTAELWKTYGWRAMVKPDPKDNVKVFEESEISDELDDGLEVPAGVTELKSGKWDARIIDPVSGDKTWLGTFDTVKEAIRSLNKGKAEFSAKRKRVEFDGSEFRPNPIMRVSEGPVKLECEFYDDQKNASISEFDEAMNLGIINEYGQLLGDYSELDEQMGFSLADEDADA